MSDVKWIKIVTDIFDDEKILLIEALPEPDTIIVVWFKILCLAGKQNNGGVLMLNDRMPYTDEMLATIFRRNISTVRLALDTFHKLGMIEIISGAVTIPNWDKHQSLDKLERVREQTRERVAEHRSKQKLLAECNANSNVTVTQCNVTEKIRVDEIREEIEIADKPLDGFDTFWKAYPRKTAKEDARKAYAALMKKKDAPTIERLIESIEAHKRSEAWKKDDGQFIPHPATYIRQGRYDDEIKSQSGGSNMPYITVGSDGRMEYDR